MPSSITVNLLETPIKGQVWYVDVVRLGTGRGEELTRLLQKYQAPYEDSGIMLAGREPLPMDMLFELLASPQVKGTWHTINLWRQPGVTQIGLDLCNRGAVWEVTGIADQADHANTLREEWLASWATYDNGPGKVKAISQSESAAGSTTLVKALLESALTWAP